MSAVVEFESRGSPSSSGRGGPVLSEASHALVLCTAAQIEQKLGEILREFFLDGAAARDLIEGPLAPMASLSARIRSCYALALIDEHEFADCEILSRIHDEFHRSPYATFQDAKVIALCRKLHFRCRHHGDAHDGPLEQFQTAAATLRDRLANRPFYIGHEKRTRRTWPL